MAENSMQKVGSDRGGYKPSAPPNYRPPTPVKVRPAPGKRGK